MKAAKPVTFDSFGARARARSKKSHKKPLPEEELRFGKYGRMKVSLCTGQDEQFINYALHCMLVAKTLESNPGV